jgi:hypothetical protein
MPGPVEEKPLGCEKLYHFAQVVTDVRAAAYDDSLSKKGTQKVSGWFQKGGAKGGRDNNLERHSRGRGL